MGMYDIDGEDQSQEKASSVALVKNGISYVFYADHMVLGAKLARYKADAERLDWCEANPEHGSMPYYEDGKFSVTWLSRQAEGVCTSQFNSLREAIDIARNALKDGV